MPKILPLRAQTAGPQPGSEELHQNQIQLIQMCDKEPEQKHPNLQMIRLSLLLLMLQKILWLKFTHYASFSHMNYYVCDGYREVTSGNCCLRIDLSVFYKDC